MEFTEHRTKKKGFSAAFELKESNFDEQKYKADKRKKMIANAIIATAPALIVPGIITKGIAKDHRALLESKNIIKKGCGKVLNLIKKKADCFDYTDSIYMSKTIFALMWLLSDYPNCLICSRDKHEVKDKAIRFGVMNVMFFGGDFLLNNILGRLSDKYAGTKIMETNNLKKDGGFFKRFSLSMKDFKELAKNKEMPLKQLTKTKNMSASIYWGSLLINMALIGLGLPAFLNKVLRNDIEKEKAQESAKTNKTPSKNDFKIENSVFKNFKL